MRQSQVKVDSQSPSCTSGSAYPSSTTDSAVEDDRPAPGAVFSSAAGCVVQGEAGAVGPVPQPALPARLPATGLPGGVLRTKCFSRRAMNLRHPMATAGLALQLEDGDRWPVLRSVRGSNRGAGHGAGALGHPGLARGPPRDELPRDVRRAARCRLLPGGPGLPAVLLRRQAGALSTGSAGCYWLWRM